MNPELLIGRILSMTLNEVEDLTLESSSSF